MKAGMKNQYITRSEVEAELLALVKVAKKMSLPAAERRWLLEPGSRQYGTDWRLWAQPAKGDGREALGFLDKGFIGRNGPEALNTLRSIKMAWQYMLDNKGGE